jgi:hypothetical protein
MGTQEKTMKLDPKIVEAEMTAKIGPFWWRGEWLTRDGADIKRCGNWLDAKDEALRLNAEFSARRVLKAASECVPDEVVEEILNSFGWHGPDARQRMRAALSAALDKWAEEEGE